MITLFLQGQKLTLAQTVVAADSVAYLTARLIYKTADWAADTIYLVGLMPEGGDSD